MVAWCSTYLNMFASLRRIVEKATILFGLLKNSWFIIGLFSVTQNNSTAAVKSHKPGPLRSSAPGGWHQLQEALTHLRNRRKIPEMAPKMGLFIADMAIEWGM